ncbi:MAG: ABC transporter ATP-binding protein [Clostridia bacterium]
MKKQNKTQPAVKKAKNNNLHTVGRMLKDAKPIYGFLFLAGIISITSVLLSLVSPLLLGNITDTLYNYVKGSGNTIDMLSIAKLCGLLAIAYVLSSACSYGTMQLMNNVVSRFYTCGLRIKISDKIKQLPISYLDSTPNGEIISRMNSDVSHMGNTIHTILDVLIGGIIKLVGITIIIFIIDPILASVVVVFVPLSLVLAGIISMKSEKVWKDYRKTNGELYSFIEEDYSGFDTVKAFNLYDRQEKKQSEILSKHSAKFKKGMFLNSIVQPIIALTDSIAYVAVCVIGGYLVINNNATVGAVVEMVLFAKLFSGPLESIADGISSMQNVMASASRVYGFLDATPMVEEPRGKIQLIGKGDVDFQNVYFSYNKDKPLIRNLNVKVSAGQKVAIVGPTGGGKTTIVNLLMRFYDVDSGRILIDGADISEINRAELRSLFSMVLQETWLFSGTVYDNIAYGKPDATREEVMHACSQAHIDYFIDTLSNGYNTVINEESTNISSGQKQLMTIARAYLSDRPMLILDEATSNVDTRTELLIQKTMDELMKSKTSFVIAHRLSTIVDADIILVVNEGTIVEQGTHRELLDKKGFYTQIYNSQYELLK